MVVIISQKRLMYVLKYQILALLVLQGNWYLIYYVKTLPSTNIIATTYFSLATWQTRNWTYQRTQTMNHMRVHDTTIKKLFNRVKIPNKRKIQQELYKNLQDIYTNLLESKRLMYNVHLLMTKHYKLSLNSPTTSQ